MRKLLTLLFLSLWVISSWGQSTAIITCTGTSGSYKSGSVSSAGVKNDGNMITINSSANRGWASYDLSTLAGATVTAVTANFTTYSTTSSGATNYLYGFTGDPATMTGAALYTACGTGTAFSSATWTADALNSLVLNATGIAFVNSNVGGIINIGYMRGSTNTYNIYGYPGVAPPNLTITYTGGAACSGTPAPGNTVSTLNPVCPGAAFTLSLQNPTAGSGVTYQWQTSPDGLDPWTNVGTSTPAYATTQTVATWYRCQVTCSGNTGTSTPLHVTMNPFSSCYCSSMPSNTADEEIYSVTIGGVSNAYNCTTVAPGPGSILNRYSNFTTLGALFTLPQSSVVPFTVEENECDGATFYSNGCAIWVDFDQSGTFDAGEQVYTEATTTISPRNILGNITIPGTALLGVTGMRITVAEGLSGTGLTPCLAYGYGETEDYLVTITLPPPCPQPINLTATAVTAFGANLTWTPGGSEASWEYVFGASPLAPPAGSGTPTTSSTVNPISSLVPSTPYQYYVRAFCGDKFSAWSGPYTFTTLIACPAPTTLGAVPGMDNAKLSWTETGTATAWDIELQPLATAFTGTPTAAGVTAIPYVYTGLASATSYHYQVRAACGGINGNSTWAGPYTFSTTCGILSLPYCQYFPTSTVPACWTEQLTGLITTNHWLMSNSANAGGTAYEAEATYSPGQGATAADNDRFVSPGFNTAGVSLIHLSFRQYLSDYAAGINDVWIKVQSSADGITWTDEWVYNGGLGVSIPAEVKEMDITNNLGATTYLAFTLAGYTYDINYWYVDDVCISVPPAHDAGTVSIDNVPASILTGSVITPKATVKNFGLNAEVFDVTMTATGGYTSTVTGVSLASGASTQVTFATWAPANGTYTVQACTQLAGDLNAANDCKSQAANVSNVGWTAGTPFPTGTYMGTGVGYTDNSVSPPVGYFFSFGGNTNSALNTECYKYNVNTATWTTLAPLPVKRVVATCAAQGNYIYVIGGSDGVAYFNTVYRYDITLDTWTLMPGTLPKTIAWGKAVAYGTNYIYLAGGVDAFTAGNVIPDVYLYDIALDTWSAATFMPGPKFGGAFARSGNKLAYVAGADAAIISNVVYVGIIDGSNPATILWSTAKSAYPGTTGQPISELVEDMTGTTAMHSKPSTNKVTYPGGAMYRFDGAPWGPDGIIVAAGSPTATWTPAVPNPCYYFNPTTDTWTAKPDVPIAVLGAPTGSVDLDNAGTHTWKLILASGYTGSITTTATQILTEIMAPATPLAVTGTPADVTGCFGNANGTITTNVTGGVAPYGYTWSNGATTPSLSGLVAGTYYLTVTDAASSTATGHWVVNQPSQIVLSAVVTAANCPAIHDGAIDLSVSGGTPGYTYLWSSGGDAQDLSALAAGTYTVTVTDANGCTQTGSWTVGLANPVCVNLSLTGTVSTAVCYVATTTITVAGGGNSFTVTSSGDVTLHAGVNILLEPGTTVMSGGHLLAQINTDPCPGPAAPITAATTGQEEVLAGLSHACFTLFPNPTSGNFTLMQKGDKTYGTVKVEVYSMNGTKVLTESMIGEKSHEFHFSDIPVGLYFVKIVADDYVETLKLIKSR
ncbi:MAG: GEVED domain-containing protein [Bacteroidetes bacterium]|nr:GEVED domain-containing protein [Bacteroidota bacterium]